MPRLLLPINMSANTWLRTVHIGGEQCGYIIFSKYASTINGILTILRIMEVILAKKKLMSQQAAPPKIYPQVIENVL